MIHFIFLLCTPSLYSSAMIQNCTLIDFYQKRTLECSEFSHRHSRVVIILTSYKIVFTTVYFYFNLQTKYFSFILPLLGQEKSDYKSVTVFWSKIWSSKFAFRTEAFKHRGIDLFTEVLSRLEHRLHNSLHSRKNSLLLCNVCKVYKEQCV